MRNVGNTKAEHEKICQMDKNGMLLIRGKPINDFTHLSYEDALAWLLFEKEKLTGAQRERLHHAAKLDEEAKKFAAKLIEIFVSPFEFYSAMMGKLSEIKLHSKKRQRDEIDGLQSAQLDQIGLTFGLLTYFFEHTPIQNGKSEDTQHTESDSLVESFLRAALRDEYSEENLKAFELYLVLVAEHGLNLSTDVSNRVASGKGSIQDAARAAGLALRAERHGGALIKCYDYLAELLGDVSKEVSTADAKAYFEKKLDEDGVVYGFGHAVYKGEKSDPRAQQLKACLRGGKEKTFFASLERVEFAAIQAVNFYKRRAVENVLGLTVNVDFWAAALFYQMKGCTKNMVQIVFMLGRMAGWCAHYPIAYKGHLLREQPGEITEKQKKEYKPRFEFCSENARRASENEVGLRFKF